MQAALLLVLLLGLVANDAFTVAPSRSASRAQPHVSDSRLQAEGFSRGGDGGGGTTSKNKKPKLKPSAQRPSVRPTRKPKGFVAPAETPAQTVATRPEDLDPNLPCGCGSGKVYGDCCKVQHTGGSGSEGNTPEQVLRARYCAFKHNIADYIIESSHPTAEDYQKYMVEARASKRSGVDRWRREILALNDELGLNYALLEVVSASVKGDVADVIFRALFMQREEDAEAQAGGQGPTSDEDEEDEDSSDYYAVEEKSQFLRVGGRWLYQDGQTVVPSEEEAQAMIDKLSASLPSSDAEGEGEGEGASKVLTKRQKFLERTPGVVAGKGGKPGGAVPGAAAAKSPSTRAFGSNTSSRKGASGGLSDKAHVLPFPSGRA